MTGDELTIGEVIGRLAADFPDLTVSKIRYLESGGLISPERTPAGYRRFTEDDIEKLRWVLSAQRDQFLPLKVIRQHLASGERPQGIAVGGGADSAGGVGGFGSGVGGTATATAAGELHMSREGLARTVGVTGAFIDDLVTYGLLPAAESYSGDAVLVARAAASLTAYGLEPRHLRPLLTGARNTAGLLSTLLVTRRADGVSADVASAAVRLYAALLRAELTPSAPGPAQN
jgi:DNA-binding transcriptional MerR regulator